MLDVSGVLVSKSVIKEGVSAHGAWRLIEFVIERTFCKKKYKIAFTTIGKRADLINETSLKERITVSFIPSCAYSEKYNRYFTELKAINVEKYIPKKKFNVRFDGEVVNSSEFELKKDNQLDFNATQETDGTI